MWQRGFQHVADLRFAFRRLVVPGEENQVTPKAFRIVKHPNGCRNILHVDRLLESRDPGCRPFSRSAHAILPF